MAKSKKITINFDGDDAPETGAMATTHQFNTVPVQNGTVVTGGILPTDLNTISVLVQEQWKILAQENIDAVTAERKAAVKVVGECETAYKLTLGKLTFPADFVVDAKALTAAFKPFFPDAVLVGYSTRTLFENLAPVEGALVPLAGLAVDVGRDSRNKLNVRAQIRGDGEVVQTLSRECPLPADVSDAYKAWVTAQAEVTKLDARLVELAKIKQSAGERGAAASAMAATKVLNSTPEGRAILETLNAGVAHMGSKAGLAGADTSQGLLALMSKPATPSASE